VISVEDSWREARKIFFQCRTGTDRSARSALRATIVVGLG
jgi:hypothetical protein